MALNYNEDLVRTEFSLNINFLPINFFLSLIIRNDLFCFFSVVLFQSFHYSTLDRGAISLCFSVCLSLGLPFFISLSNSLSASSFPSLSFCVCLFLPSLSFSVCLFLSLSHSLSASFFLSPSLPLSL